VSAVIARRHPLSTKSPDIPQACLSTWAYQAALGKELMARNKLPHGEWRMSSTRSQDAFGAASARETAPQQATVQEVKTADEHIVLVLSNLHDSLKWVFTVLMGGSVYFAASTLFGIQAKSDFPPAQPTFLFILFSLTFFRFYWGWARYSDIRYLEVPRLIVSFREDIIARKGERTYERAIKTALTSTTGFHMFRDEVPRFFQTMILFMLAGSIGDENRFAHWYIVLLFFNALFLLSHIAFRPYHVDALATAFTRSDYVISPSGGIHIWIINNLICGSALVVILALSARNLLSGGTATALDLAVISLNCCADLLLSRKMYVRSTNRIWQLCREGPVAK
jgi:hypothetical protein